MNARSAVFSYVSIRPCRIRELFVKLPYKKDTIYRAVETLVAQGWISKGKDGVVRVSPDYHSQKRRELFVKSLSYGIDPEILLRKSTLAVWSAVKIERTLPEIRKETALSKKWIARTVAFLERSGLVVLKKRRPIIVVRDHDHELTSVLEMIVGREKDQDTLFIPESSPFEERLLNVRSLEKALFEEIDNGLAVQNTGFLVKGERLHILENVDHEPGPEEMFLIRIGTTKGVENDCIRLIASNEMNYSELLMLAEEKDMVNVVGCYLDIVNNIRPLIDSNDIERFHEESKGPRSCPRHAWTIFLEEEKQYGKEGWEKPYEEKWAIDLYLDIGAIRNGVRAV